MATNIFLIQFSQRFRGQELYETELDDFNILLSLSHWKAFNRILNSKNFIEFVIDRFETDKIFHPHFNSMFNSAREKKVLLVCSSNSAARGILLSTR